MSLYAQTDGYNWYNTEYNSTEGTDFWVTFMCNSGAHTNDIQNMELYLYITAREETDITIANPNITAPPIRLHVKAWQQVKQKIDNGWAYIYDNEKNAGIHITSTKPVSVYSTSHHNSGKYDGSNILPTDALLGSYVVQTYLRDQYATEFAIVATTNNQTIELNINEIQLDRTKFENANNPILDTIDTRNEKIIVTLNAGQTYLYRSSNIMGSLSGTTLCSDYPFALFEGGQSVMIPSTPENHIFHQSYPTDLYGQTFIVTPTYYAVYDYIRITAAENGTQLYRDGKFITTLQAFETFQDTLRSTKYYIDDDNISYTPTTAKYTTTKPVECYLYGTGNSVNGPFISESSKRQATYDYGSPVMTPVIPQELGLNSCIFATFADISQNMKHYVNIVTYTSQVAGMRLDGHDISSKFSPIASDPTYSYAIIEVTGASHFLENSNNSVNSTFTARVYGLGKSSSAAESYAYAAGSRINHRADILIDGEYIKEKTICLNDDIDFESVVNYDHSSPIHWEFEKAGEPLEKFDSDKVLDYIFPSTGDWNIHMVVEQKTPICDYTIRDTINAIIHVKDIFKIEPTQANGSYRIVCESDRSDDVIQGRTYQYRTDTMQVNKIYSYVDSLQTLSGCDSIIYIKVRIAPEYKIELDTTLCENHMPFKWTTYDHNGTYTQDIPRNDFPDTGSLPFTKTYQKYLETVYGCDSIVSLNVTINAVPRDTITAAVCDNEQQYQWKDGQDRFVRNIKIEGLSIGTHIYNDTLQTEYGCDDIRTLELQVLETFYDSICRYICAGETYLWKETDKTEGFEHVTKNWQDTLLTTSGVYRRHLYTDGGCDDIRVCRLFIGDTFNIHTFDTICQSALPWKEVLTDSKGNMYECIFPLTDLGGKPADKLYTHTLKTAAPFDCDSTVSVHLHILPTTVVDTTVLWCTSAGPYTFPSSNKSWTETGDYIDTLTIKNIYGCDSILHLHLEVLPEIATSFTVDWCDNELPYNHTEFPDITEWQNLTKSGEYQHIFTSTMGCDSVVTMNFVVHQHNKTEETVYYCKSDLPYTDKDFANIQAYGDTTYTKTLTNRDGCDSIVKVQVLIGDTFNIHTFDTICQSALPWKEVLTDSKGNMYECIFPLTDLGGKPADKLYTHTLKTAAPFDCDSTVSVHLHILPTTVVDTTVLWCTSAGPYTFPSSNKSWTETGDYIDTLTVKNIFGCDSILHLHLKVLPNIITRIDTMICDNEVPFSHSDPLTENLHNLTKTGVFYDTLQTALSGCDSIIELHLTVNPTYHIYDYQQICDNEVYVFNDSVFACSAGYYEYDTLLHTIHGCDSLVTLQLHVYPTYRFEQVESVCQDTINKYDWVDANGGVHPMIDISKVGDFTIYDTLKTIHGCDSIYGLRLHVSPIYRFDSLYTACDNETIYWQGRQYSGIKADPINGWEPGVYYDTAFYKTPTGCDSTYYLQYIFYPTYDTTIYVSACYDGTDGLPYYWETYDNSNNKTYIDTIPLTLFDNAESSKEFSKLLHTTHGCDSLVHLQLNVHPTYKFTTDTTICSNEFVEWRGKRYRQEGIYYDSLQTETFGCDSIYELRLRVKPAYLTELFAGKRCDNKYYILPNELTELWTDTIFFKKDTINYGPDELREEIYTRTFFTEEGCDSIYKVHVTVCPTYSVQETPDTVCSNEPYLWHGMTYHLQPGLQRLDTTFLTVYGCDSTFTKDVYVKQAYQFYQSDSICQNEELHWQNRVLKDLSPGTHRFDTIYTTYDGCDSIYTEYLTVFPTYYNHIYDTICDNEIYLWQNRELMLTEGKYHYDTTYTTLHGCDSIFVLDVIVYPTSEETRYDTICAGEWYILPNKRVNTAGYYVDTTTNEFGCNHYIYLYLEVVPPTRLNAHIDTICADEKAFEIIYHYQGTFPVEYSVYFTAEGQEQGFEDIIHAPILNLKDSIITIEIPYGDELPKPNEQYYDGVTHRFTTEPKHQYVQPDIYPIKVYLHNGVCSDDTLAYDRVDALIQYPHWIHEQHWNDAIVLYKDTFNGGYEFIDYQWYENGIPLEGEIGDYLYLPHNLQRDAYYQVALTRKSDGKTFMTCPITPAFNVDSIVPRLPYFSVVPTLVYTSHPYVSILCSIGGYYEIYHPMGKLVQGRTRFEPEYDASTLIQNPELPANVMKDDIYLDLGQGIYIIKLTADNGEERRIKIIVTNETY